MIVTLSNIVYETDGEDVKGLPETWRVAFDDYGEPEDDMVDKAVELLSDDTGWLVYSYNAEVAYGRDE